MAGRLKINGRVGGGQILRSSLSLSVMTGIPFEIEGIRETRSNPGLRRQHLTAVTSAAAICDADVVGAEIGSRQISFTPGPVQCRDYEFSVGTAGSAGLVFQTVMPALVYSSGYSSGYSLGYSENAGGNERRSRVKVEGGTHNWMSPPFEFLDRCFGPIIKKMGFDVRLELDRYGFFPAGGGQYRIEIGPFQKKDELNLTGRPQVKRIKARAILAGGLPVSIAERELDLARTRLGIGTSDIEIANVNRSLSPGNCFFIEVELDTHTEVFTGFGQKGRRAEEVAELAITQTEAYLQSGAAVSEHLSDELPLPLFIAGKGSFTAEMTDHLRTNLDVIEQFLPGRLKAEPVSDRLWAISHH